MRHPLEDLLSQYKLILASASPRRKELLASLDVYFEVRVVPTDESFPVDLEKEKVAAFIARQKAKVQDNLLNTNELLITSDTVVLLKNEVLAKPQDSQEAEQMLLKLAGKTHQVITGVCLKTQEKEVCFSDMTKVIFRSLSLEEVRYYIHHYKPFDKAGSYGIQEWIGMIGITSIQGSYFNVMGLPLEKLYEQLRRFSTQI